MGTAGGDAFAKADYAGNEGEASLPNYGSGPNAQSCGVSVAHPFREIYLNTLVSSLANHFSMAVQHYQSGNAPAAELLLRQLVQAAPERAEAHHLLGVIAYQAGRYEQAVDSIRRAL